MTTTVTVKARGHGVTVEVGGETTEVLPHHERNFHIAEGSQSFNITQLEAAPAAEAEEAPAKPTNESGATETAQRSGRGSASEASAARSATPVAGASSGE